MDEFRVILNGETEAEVPVSPAYRDRPLSAVLARSGFVLNTRCGQKGLCRGCEIQIDDGPPVKSCQISAESVLGKTLQIPDKSLIQSGLSVVVDFQPGCAFEIRPLHTCTDARPYGVCIDIGTTTVVMALVDLRDGKILGKTSRYNAQVRVGEDVLTRIEAASQSREAVREGQRLLVEETLGELWSELSGQTGCAGGELAGAVVAGNTTMLHFLLDEDPTPMGKVPFTPVFLEAQWRRHDGFPWGRFPWGVPGEMPWYLLPGYGAYVGADIAAGWLSSGMSDRKGTDLLIDIGTNGEILLQHAGRLTGCATAAGPAFEGTYLSWGTRAIEGAVSRMHGDPLQPETLRVEFVGHRKLRAPGFCGSAYIDFLAIGALCGLIQANGRFDRDLAARHGVPMGEGRYGHSWFLDPADTEGPSISEADIALLLQAKAAIAAGTEILLKQSGIAFGDIEKVFLAGGFGLNLGIENAITCGLLSGFRRDQIEVVGNSSLGGAYVCLLDSERAAELETAAQGARIIELNADPEFEDTYIDHLNLE